MPTRRSPLPELARLKPSTMPGTPQPMLCTLVDEPFDDDHWIFEPKFDGLRVLVQYDGKKLTLMSRNQKDQAFAFPEIIEALKKNLTAPAILDGEIVCLGPSGQPDFNSLQQRFHLKQAEVVTERMRTYPAFLYLFDVLYFDRFDVTALELERRKKVLRAAVGWDNRIRWTPHFEGRGTDFFKQTCSHLGEGLVAKRRDSYYSPERGSDWLKIKCQLRQEFTIIGYTDPKGSRQDLGALLIGYRSDDGRRLVYAGKVGTGFDAETLRDLRTRLEPLVTRKVPVSGRVPAVGVHWVKPELVAEIAFSEWTPQGALRHPRFMGLRLDKPARDVYREKPRTLQSPQESQTMPLEKYRHMRDFNKTREPEGNQAGRKMAKTQSTFVIQEHDATRLHYDFRLEADGVLKSWAVTKEPTLDPSIKRLAVEVEDHPLDYAKFEGDIPEGQYGGGHVEIWDKGSYENLSPGSVTQAIRAGRLKFRLEGSRLKGVFSLIRMKRKSGKPQWLLIKSKDEAARKMPPGRIAVLVSGKPETIEFTHTEKVMFPRARITKRQVLDFYQKIAPRLLPFLRDRPITLERLPEGLSTPNAPHFWQKNTPAHYPSWIPRLRLPSETGKPVDYVLIENKETLLYLVNQGALTFHAWASRLEDLDRPDFVLFDLDPGSAPFSQVVKIARDLREVLKKLGLKAYVKTSGQTGLHVFVPWREPGDHDTARAWALGIAGTLVARNLEIATVERSKAKRKGRIYVDVMQNARGHHVVPPYVLRTTPEATVSMPLEWNQLTDKLDPRQFTLQSVFKYLARRKSVSMEEIIPARKQARRSTRTTPLRKTTTARKKAA